NLEQGDEMATVTIDSHSDDASVPSNGKVDVYGKAAPAGGITTGCSVWCVIYTDAGAIEGDDSTPPMGANWAFHFDEVPTDTPVSIWAQAIDAQDPVGHVSSTGYAVRRLNTAIAVKKHTRKKVK